MFHIQLNAQGKKLEDLSFLELEKKIDSSYNRKEELWIYINHYIKKSKEEKNDEALIYAYRYASGYSVFPENLKYSDSILIIAQKNKNKKLITESLINRSYTLMDNFMHKEALKYIIQAHNVASKIGDYYLINKSKYFIAQNKIYLGLNSEANKELKSCVKYFRSNLKENKLGVDNELFYMYSLLSLIDSNSKIKNHKENVSLLNEAFNYIKKKNLKEYYPYFVSSLGTEAYYNNNFLSAIKYLQKSLDSYNDQWQHYTEIFYIGLSYWKLGNKKEAVKYFEKLDKEYYIGVNRNPQYRPAYELLIEYYASKNNTDKQLEYINKLMSLDKSYEKNYKYLFAKIHKEYDSQKLIDEKNSIENSLKVHQYLTLLVIIISIVLISFSTYKYFQIQRKYKKRFEQIISKNTEIEKIPVTIVKEDKTLTPKIAGISGSTITNILEELEIFEKEQQFLDSKITQKLLSEKLGTNPTYLSKIINAYKGKNFSNYLNDLRLEYIVELLKTEHQFLEKEIKELANIAGFTNAEAFSDNFQRKFEIKPSYFIKMMKENIKTSSL